MTTEERLEKLERELTTTKRRNRWMLGGATLLIVGCLTIAAMPGDKQTIRAQQFIVVDDQGKDRASLTVDKDGTGLVLRDANGKARLALAVFSGGPGLNLYDENGKIRASLAALLDGTALIVRDENGKIRADLTVDQYGSTLGLSDENGKIRASLAVTSKTLAALAAVKDGPILKLRDANGKEIWSAP